MMKANKAFWIPTAVIAVALASIAAQPQTTAVIAFVNLPEILDQTPGFTAAQDVFQSEVEAGRRDLQAMQARVDTMIQTFEREQAALNSQARQRRVDQIRDAQRQIQTAAKDQDERAYDREQELLAPIQDRVQATIDQIRAERRLVAIVDLSADGSGVLSSDPDHDLTQAVIQRVRRSGGR
jgi:outer membrane protein